MNLKKSLFKNSQSNSKTEEFNQELKRISSKLKNISRTVEEQDSIIKETISKIEETKTQTSDLMKKSEELLNKIESQEKTLQKTIAELSLFKPKMEKELINKFSLELEKELANATNKINAELSGFNTAKESFSKYLSKTKDFMNEMDKFNSIAKTIKEKDFSLIEFEKILENNDKEKLRLMKKIDQLENLLAKMKRSKR